MSACVCVCIAIVFSAVSSQTATVVFQQGLDVFRAITDQRLQSIEQNLRIGTVQSNLDCIDLTHDFKFHWTACYVGYCVALHCRRLRH